jgi:hypothetical protein
MIKAATSVGFIFIILVLVTDVFASLFTAQLEDRKDYPLTPYCADEEARGENKTDDCLEKGAFGETGPDMFATLGDSFLSLFTRGVLGDNLAETVQAILDSCPVDSAGHCRNFFLTWMFISFLIITFATLLNMLIGVMCEVISEEAREEKLGATVTLLKETIDEAFHEIDENGDGRVCIEEWTHIKAHPEVRKTLPSLGIEDERMDERLAQLQEMLFADEDLLEEEVSDSHVGKSVGTGSTSAGTGSQKSGRMSRTSSERQEAGIDVDVLIDRVVDLRPDQSAGALELELLKGKVSKDQVSFKRRLKTIEEDLRKIIGPSAESLSRTAKSSRSQAPSGIAIEHIHVPEPGKQPASNRPTSISGTDLKDFPSQMLIQALRNRALQPGMIMDH